MSTHYYPLINKIITQLRLRDSNQQLSAITASPFVRPFITVAREPGSGGRPVAKLLAERLSFTFVDEQIVEEIARSTKKRKAIIQEVDEKTRDNISDLVHSLFNKEYVDDVKYLTELARVILTYAIKGHAVILGRGANFITPFAKGLHVNITAPYDVRVKRAMDYEGHSEEKAKQVIKEVETERNDFVKQYLRKNPQKTNSYDLSINTTYFSVAETAEVLEEAFYRKFPRSVRYPAMFR